MTRMFMVRVVAVASLAAVGFSRWGVNPGAQAPPTATADDPVGYFRPDSAHEVPASATTSFPRSLDHPDDDPLRAIEFDLNGDGKKEFIWAYGPRACGTGGCPFELYDGGSRKRLGDLFGNSVFVLPQKINGWPVLTVYSHGSATSGSYTSHVFDGAAYVQTSSVMLYGRSVTELFEKLKKTHEIK